MFHTIRMILGIILFAGLGMNFFYQGIKGLRQLYKRNYSEETLHTFKCRECEEVYEMNGVDLQNRTSAWSPKLQKRTPTSQMTAIRFECPACHEKAFQEKVYDTNVTAALGNIRAQFDDSSKEILRGILLKGFLPVLIGMPILGLLL